jgi:acyl phosphate:glycerol-3-phosphate acyltransferase
MFSSILLCALIGYLCGSLPNAYLVSRALGGNVFEKGSGNPGATNMLIQFGKKAGAAVLLLDLAKGFLPTFLTAVITGDSTLAAWAGTGAVLGHVASLYTKFRGGKALATAGGVLLFLKPLPLIVIVVAYIVLLRLTRSVVIGTTIVVLASVLLYLFSGAEVADKLALLTMVTAVMYRHLPNWERVYLGNEPKIPNKVSELTLERLPKEQQRKLRVFYYLGAAVVYALVIFLSK